MTEEDEKELRGLLKMQSVLQTQIDAYECQLQEARMRHDAVMEKVREILDKGK